MLKRFALLSVFGAVAASSHAVVIFQDDFETGNLSKWGTTVTAGFTVDGTNPHTGSFAANAPATAARMATTLSSPIALSQFRLDFWMYDNRITDSGRQWAEIRDYTGDAYLSGTLTQLYAIGKYNTNDAGNGTFNSQKYSARVAFGGAAGSAGWFNLSLAANRTVGWHKFSIDFSGTNVNFYVDDVLGASVARGSVGNGIDSLVMGSNVSSANHPAVFDDFVVQSVPEPASMAALALGIGAVLRRRRVSK